MKRNSLYLLLFTVLIASCKKEINQPRNGLYHGQFYKLDSLNDTSFVSHVNLAIFEQYSTYTVSGDTAVGTPVNHQGDYIIENSSLIRFEIKQYPNLAYYSNSDTTHYLDTTYNYTFDDVNFHLWATRRGVKLGYNLRRK